MSEQHKLWLAIIAYCAVFFWASAYKERYRRTSFSNPFSAPKMKKCDCCNRMRSITQFKAETSKCCYSCIGMGRNAR